MKAILFIVVILLVISGNVDAKVYYVSPTGVNTNSGLTLSLAWKTLTFAAGSSSPVVAGDTVYVKSGSYGAEKVIFQKSGTSAKPISFIGYKTTPGDAPPLLVNRTDAYAAFLSTDMPLFDGGNRASGTAFDCRKQKYLVIKNFQVQNYQNGLVTGGPAQDAGFIMVYNVNAMFLGDISASYSGQGILLGSMGTSFSNNNTLENCLVVNAAAECFGINGDNNVLKGCKAYCNENKTGNTPSDYYIIVCGSYNTVVSCYIERAAGLTHKGHGMGAKTNAEQVIDKKLNLPTIVAQYNKFYYCTAKNMGESFYVRHRTAQYNLFYHCKAIGTHTGITNSAGGEGNCVVTRDGASNNTFDGCIAENCAAGFVFEDSVEDGDTGASPTGHPGNNNKYINCLIYNCYIGVSFSNNGAVQSDAGDNTIANCTFYKNRYTYDAERHCMNMKYVGNIYVGCLPSTPGGYFKGGVYTADILPNGTNTYFKNCNFINIQGGMPANFVANSVGSIAKDPLFVDPAALNFHLKPTSPCIDASIAQVPAKNDFDSIARPTGAGVDMGAYEYISLTPLAVVIASSNVSCNGGNNGKATATLTGGKAPYTYLWSNGQTSNISSGLIAGNYSVTISDATPSSKVYTLTITQPLAISASITTQTNVSCSGGNNGSATVTAGGGSVPYIYSWGNGQTTAVCTGLSAGNYVVTVKDMNGCTKATPVTISQPSAITASMITVVNASACSLSDGSVKIIASGGIGSYVYKWNTVPVQTTDIATGLAAGKYTVTIYDTKGCSGVVTATVTCSNPTGIISLQNDNAFYVYPNPTSGILNVVSENDDNTITIFDFSGKEVYTVKSASMKAEINMQEIADGIYFLRIENSKSIKTLKVILTR